MSKIMRNLQEIKRKIKENLAQTKKEDVDLNSINDNVETVDSYFESLDNIIYINIGGEKISRLMLKYIYKYSYILSIKADIINIKTNNKDDPYFIDICLDAWETLYDIIRLNPIANIKTELTLYTNAETDILEFEGKNLFGDDWSIIKKKIKFSTKFNSELNYELLNQYNEMNFLDKKYTTSLCCFCNIESRKASKMNKILIKDEYTRKSLNKSSILNGFYMSCVTCDPNRNRPILVNNNM